MNTPFQSTNHIPYLLHWPALVLIALLASVVMLPETRAVTPPPDGGYPGGNTAEGQSALLNLTTGTYNTAVGFLSLTNHTADNFNTAVGAGALLADTVSYENTAIGAGAMLSNTAGVSNSVVGAFALFENINGAGNTAVGVNALFSNTSGGGNTAIGSSTLQSNTDGLDNTAVGSTALNANTGSDNTAVGAYALSSNTGSYNTAVGTVALGSNMTGINNVALGYLAGFKVITANNVICIGHFGEEVNDSCFIGNIRDVQTQYGDAINVVIDSHGQLGTVSSSQRFKKEIKPMDKASEAILALKPVSFQYKNDSKKTPQFGLIAEEVAKVNPDLVVRGRDGEIYSVRYEAVNAMLLNEFLKEHKAFLQERDKVQEQDAIIAQLKSGMQALNATVKEQAAQIQKVSAQLDATKPTTQLTLTSR